MAKITVLAVDKLRSGHFAEAAAMYLKRARRFEKVVEIEVKAAKGARDAGEARRIESQRLLARRPSEAMLVALDERGVQWNSARWASWMGEQLDVAKPICFAVGGANGHHEHLRSNANVVLGLSAMTLPHELARVVLYEQIYRALTMIHGVPYHK